MEEKTREVKDSAEFKKKTDDFLQKNMNMYYEDLRVDNPDKKQGMMGFYEILDIEENEIGLRDLELDMPFVVERNKIFDSLILNRGEIIWAKIFSNPEDGMTSEWFFEEVEKPIKGKTYKSGNY